MFVSFFVWKSRVFFWERKKKYLVWLFSPSGFSRTSFSYPKWHVYNTNLDVYSTYICIIIDRLTKYKSTTIVCIIYDVTEIYRMREGHLVQQRLNATRLLYFISTCVAMRRQHPLGCSQLVVVFFYFIWLFLYIRNKRKDLRRESLSRIGERHKRKRNKTPGPKEKEKEKREGKFF